jgi:glycolate oxidase FAD binding subunit
MDSCTIDGFGPLALVRPKSVAELSEVVHGAAAEGSALYPVGGRTQLGLGNPPIRAGFAVGLRGLDRVADFQPRDMTITAQSGITIARLQALLAAENLRLPIDVPQGDRATLGGIVATNPSGPRRYGCGTLRDYVIGISAVNDEGREFKAGGRVVKNVAGYDLCKLLIGSLGTLGIITQVTLKLRPLPEEQALISLGCEVQRLDGLLEALHGTRTRPVCIDLLNRPAAVAVFRRAGCDVPHGAWTAVVGYEGNEEAVRWQVQQLIVEVSAASGLEARVGFTAKPLWDALTEGAAGEAAVTFKANMLPSTVAAFCQAVDGDSNQPALQAHVGNGIVIGSWPDELTEQRTLELRTDWCERVARGQGVVVVERCPPSWKRTVPVWDAVPDGWLMRAVKDRFDRGRIFNPGRFVEGI